MDLKKISRSKSFEMVNSFGLKRWEKYGIEGDLADNEDPIQAYKELDLILDQAHKENNQDVSLVADNVVVPVIEVKKTSSEKMVEAISACTALEVLKTFEKLSNSTTEFKKAYDNRLKELQNG